MAEQGGSQEGEAAEPSTHINKGNKEYCKFSVNLLRI
jgi:hypothetical protein